MATRELGRFRLRDRLVETLGEDAATELMDSLPPFPWNELATKDDLTALKEWTETRFDNLEASIDTRFDAVDTQFAAVAAEFVGVRGEILAVEGRLSLQIAELAQHVAGLSEKMAAQSADLSEKMVAQSRMLVFTFAGFAATICGAMAGGILFA